MGVVGLKVFWDVATKTVAIKHMCWRNKAIIVFLNSGFTLFVAKHGEAAVHMAVG